MEMRAFIVCIAAASCVMYNNAIEILKGPEVLDTVLPEFAYIFSQNYAVHTTLDDLNLRQNDVYILPKPPKLDDYLSALNGVPITRQPKPFSMSETVFQYQPYQDSKLKIAEARAAELSASLAPVAEVASPQVYLNPSKFFSVEIAPGPYRSIIYIIFQSIVFAFFVPAALFGLRYAKTKVYIKKTLPLTTFFFYYFSFIVILQNVLHISSIFALPISFVLGFAGMYYSFRAVNSIVLYNEKIYETYDIIDKRHPLGWVMCIKTSGIVSANMLYHMASSIFPYPYGVAGLLTSNSMIAGLLYTGILALLVCTIMLRLKQYDELKVQNAILSIDCAYIAVSGLSFYTNVIAVYIGILDFTAFEPAVFFSLPIIYELNLTTIFFTLVFFAMVAAGYHEHSKMDENNKTVNSMASLTVDTFDESSRALNEALNDMSMKGV